MRRFTNSPYERMMTRIPQTSPQDKPTAPLKGHPCYGCKRYGEGCVLPCYRGITMLPAKI